MNKLIILCITTSIFINVLKLNAQVVSQKIGTNPMIISASAVLEIESSTKGFLPPRMTQTQRDEIVNPATGLMVYCVDCSPTGDLQVFNGSVWAAFSTSSSASSVVSDCSVYGFSGSYISGTAMTTSNKFSVTITNNSFTSATIAFQPTDLIISGITGITVASVTPVATTLNPGQSQLVEYNLSGTATTGGILKGTWSKLILSCIKSIAVTNTPIASLDCATASHNGTLLSGTAASGVSTEIAYTGGDGSAYSEQEIPSTGVTGLTATLLASSFATGAGSLVFTITGIPASSGTASFPVTIGGQSCTFTRTVTLPPAVIATIDCAGATTNGTLLSGTAASGVSSAVSYTGGNGGTYAAQIIASTGVTGLTASLTAGTVASGTGSFVFTITGTPASSGTASFPVTIGGQSCTFTRTVTLPPAVIATIDCAGATTNGTLLSGTAASGVSSVVSYTGGNGGTYAAQIIASTGVTGLTASLTAGTVASGSGSLVFTITGTPASSGTASFPVTIGGQSCTFTRTVTLPPAVIATIDCAGATTNGTLLSGTAASGVSSAVSYTGGNGGTYAAQIIASTGVTGLTASLTAGTVASGTGSFVFTITGTPASSGTASFPVTIGGQSCTFTRTIASPIVMPTTITLAQNRTFIVTSVFDQDYLPYTSPTGLATTNSQAANGVNETKTINIQGTITTAGVLLKIPVTATASNTLPAFSNMITIPAAMTEDGISREATLSWGAQAYTTATKTINATIAAVGGVLNLKKLDINAGIGNDALGVLIGQFTYPFDSTGNTTTYSIRVIPVIPDKLFGLPDNTTNSTTHLMLYSCVVAEDGKIWLNNNLGAHYANINHANFNPVQQATSATDYLAYGSQFQWGRKPDGHELITYTNSTTGTVVNGTGSINADTPTDALFIVESNSPFDWRVNQDSGLWTLASGINNPCPIGFRVPTLTEQDNLINAATITNSATAASSILKFTVAGKRDATTGSLLNVGTDGFYWNSSVSGSLSNRRGFSSGSTSTIYANRSGGFCVRCIKN